MKQHDWRETGQRGAHVDFLYRDEKGRHRHCLCPAIYVRCSCGAIGFRKPDRRVVYTWCGVECPKE